MQQNMMSQNIIITERCSSLRQLGRNALRGKWRNGILAMIIFVVCLQLPQLIFNQLFGINMANLVTDDGYTYNMDAQFYMELYNSMPQTSILSGIWVLLISGALELGLTIYFLASFRGHMVVPKDVFLGFERFGKALGLFCFRFLFIYLWTMLFIIPGIIAAIRYSQAFFVLADDPTKSIRQCMNESKAMMRGNKGKYFLLGLSFIGWYILATIPAGFLTSMVSTLGAGDAGNMVASLIGSLFLTPVYLYIGSTFAGFYEILAGHLIKETEPVPLSPDQIDIDAPTEKIEEVIEQVQAIDKPVPEEAEPPALPEEPQLPGDPQAKAGQPEEDIPDAEILPDKLDEEDTYRN